MLSTMPHILTDKLVGTSYLNKYTWGDRIVGDDTTNPVTNFVGQNN